MNPYAPPKQPIASGRRKKTIGPRASAYLKGARGTLTLLGSIFLMLGIFQFISAEENVSRRIAPYARSVNETSFDYDAEVWEKAVVEASKPVKWEAGVVAILGVVFLFGGWLVFSAPLTSTIGGLVLFFAVLLLSAMNNPATLLSGIVVKILAIACLMYSIKEAVHFHQAKQRFQAAQRHHDMGEGHSTV